MHTRLLLCTRLLPALVLVIGTSVLAQGPPVTGPLLTLEGNPVNLTPPPLRMAGEVFVPLQGFADAVGAAAEFDRGRDLLRLTRNQVRVSLWLGQRSLAVGSEPPRTIPLAPVLVGDTPYLPLSPVVAAWGGQLTWDPATETAALTFPTPGRRITGMLLQIYEGEPPVFLVQREPGRPGSAYVAAAGIAYLRAKQGENPQPVGRQDLRLGDQVELFLDNRSRITEIRAFYQEKAGQLQALAEDRLVLADGTVLHLASGVQARTPQGQDLDLAALTPGANLTVRYNPAFGQVWEIIAEPPAQPAQELKIVAVNLVNYTRPLRAGETLNVRILGTGGATVRFQIGEAYRNLPAREDRPGRYVAQFTVPANANVTNQPVTAFLEKGGRQAEPLTSLQTVTFDTTPPGIARQTPAPDSQITNREPVLGATFDDAGSGVDLASAAFSLDGDPVEAPVVTTRGKAAVQAPLLEPGLHRVEFSVKDLAGNERSARWSFRILAEAEPALLGVTHNGLRRLTEQDTLEVLARSTSALTNPVADLGTWKTGLPLTRVPGAANFVYRLTYPIQPGDRLDAGTVTVRARDRAGRNVQMAATYPLSIITGLPTELRILQPAEGSVTPRELVLSGTAPPESLLRVTINYTTRFLIEISGEVTRFTVQAGEDGTWQIDPVDVRLPLFGMADKYQVVVELLDAGGATVATQTLNLKGK